jgi:SAM-dependent methyltransferase
MERPDRYARSGEFLVFNAAEDSDFDWLEQHILTDGYYEQPGPWGYGVDKDKTVLASLVAALGAREMLEVGCGDGGTLVCAEHLGVKASGLDISAYSRARARRSVRDKIRIGDLLDVDLPRTSLLCAFDLVEHISPNRIDAFMDRVHGLLEDGGLAVFNTPAYGDDPVFGLVHGYWMAEWRGEQNENRLWRHIPCYETGFPLMGHLIWADWRWWTGLFERHGLRRLEAVERQLHAKFDAAMSYSEARKSYFVLGQKVDEARVAELCAAVDGFELDRALASCAPLIDRRWFRKIAA